MLTHRKLCDLGFRIGIAGPISMKKRGLQKGFSLSTGAGRQVQYLT
jgi:hypothetical protein